MPPIPIDDATLLNAWEATTALARPWREVVLLAGVSGEPVDVLARLPIGERDRRLLVLRTAALGERPHRAAPRVARAAAPRALRRRRGGHPFRSGGRRWARPVSPPPQRCPRAVPGGAARGSSAARVLCRRGRGGCRAAPAAGASSAPVRGAVGS